MDSSIDDESAYVLIYKQSSEYATLGGLWKIESAADAHIYDRVLRPMTEEEKTSLRTVEIAPRVYTKDVPFVVCGCTSCFSYDFTRDAYSERDTSTATRNIENKHCIACMCKDCVCDVKRSLRLYDRAPLVAGSFSNPCFGRCLLCQQFKTKTTS
jgi:hypothetical protein